MGVLFRADRRPARARLRTSGRRGRDAASDEEDAALSAFDSLCAGLARGQFPQLADRDDLWRLLVVITTRKVQAQSRRQLRQKRGGGKVQPACDVDEPDSDDDLLARAVGSEPTPEFAAMVAEEYRLLIARLGDDVLRKVASSAWRATPPTPSPTSSAAPAAPSRGNWP